MKCFKIARIVKNTLLIGLLIQTSLWAKALTSLRFEDITSKSGVSDHFKNWNQGHASAWGDIDGDGDLDLFVAAFADRGVFKKDNPPPVVHLFRNDGERFTKIENAKFKSIFENSRNTFAQFADLDGDGDNDLIVSRMALKAEMKQNLLLENRGNGNYVDRTPKSNWPHPRGTRNIGVLDLDFDGKLDLVLTDDQYTGYLEHRKNPYWNLIALRNKGDWHFEDVSAKYGFPTNDARGEGLAIGDVNGDGLPDIFVVVSNTLMLSQPDGTYKKSENNAFAKPAQKENYSCGGAFGDLNNDDRLDLVYTYHGQPTRLFVYLNTGVKNGEPVFRDISAKTKLDREFPMKGLSGKSLRTTHVSICDMDLDGMQDIALSLSFLDEKGKAQPVILKNLGNFNGTPKFSEIPYEKLFSYYSSGGVSDYNSDGRLDVLLCGWYTQDKTPLTVFRNRSAGGSWLKVYVKGANGPFNTSGIGAIVRAYPSGAKHETKNLLGRRDIVAGTGYSSGEEIVAHFGLGETRTCDIVVQWREHKKTLRGVKVNQNLNISFP